VLNGIFNLRPFILLSILGLFLLLAGCDPSPVTEEQWTGLLDKHLDQHYKKQYNRANKFQTASPFDYVKNNPALPNILIIGDSISISYTLTIRETLKNEANVYRIPGNGGPSANGTMLIDTWLNMNKWDLIVFNFGLHDVRLKYTDQQYMNNLSFILQKLEKTGAKIYWINTTPVPDNTPEHTNKRVIQLNHQAAELMKSKQVDIIDLYSYVTLNDANAWQLPQNVHFKKSGSVELGKYIAGVLQDNFSRSP